MNVPGRAALELRAVRKVYPGNVCALDGVDIELVPGEIHALCGENGAGKTTLVEIAAGELRPTSGSVHAIGNVGLVHQHFELIGRLHVWENVVLGFEPRRGVRLDAEAARARVRALSQSYGLELDPDALVEDLPVGIAQRVELVRELARDPAVLIFDEPTAGLAPAEIASFFATVRALAARGAAVLIVTHKLGEIVAYAERATVLRAGKVVARFGKGQIELDAIARAMVGGEIPALAERVVTALGMGLVARDLEAGQGAHALRSASFEVRRGEILAIAGVEGNGQSVLADAIAGVVPSVGSLELEGTPLQGGARERIARGVRTIPGDRQREGLIVSWSLVENAVLGDQDRPPVRKGIAIDRVAAGRRAREIVERFDVRTTSIRTTVATLSGGNQQKLVVGRALAGAPRLLLAYQPTRGIAVGAAALVQSSLIAARNAGAAVLLISFELDEILALADRIAVIYRGMLSATMLRDAFDRGTIGALMAGAQRAS